MSRFDYPNAVDSRSGCKVSWLHYATLRDAEKASTIAKREANDKSNLGYDFGYCAPGSITKLDNGLYEVCIP